MSYANLNRVNQTIDGFDSIIIVKDLTDVPCGVALNTTGWAETSVKAGVPIVEFATSEGKKDYKPVACDYTLAEGEKFFGLNKTTILTAVPMAAVLRTGAVNAAAAKESLGKAYSAALVAALPHIDFLYL